jgi:dolichol-phosphate mannosyltransferase
VRLSVVIPARNEEGAIEPTLAALTRVLRREAIEHEIIVADDGSTDSTAAAVRRYGVAEPVITLAPVDGPHGYGYAVRAALTHATGDAVAIMMADGSDSPEDLVRYWRKIEEGFDCVFGSRFVSGSRVADYPAHKMAINRLANWFIQALFGLRYNDITNAFKCYRREAIQGMQPLISPHFNLTVEMPLKAIIRGYSYAVIPISWENRRTGISKLKLQEMGSRYLFIVLYLWLEKLLSRGDYRRKKSSLTKSGTAL